MRELLDCVRPVLHTGALVSAEQALAEAEASGFAYPAWIAAVRVK